MAFECVHGTLGGVNFGPHMKVLCRSPEALLLWVPGHQYWSGRQANYGAASLYLIDTRKTGDVYRNYKELKTGGDGGRLSAAKIMADAERIDAVFGEGRAKEIAATVKAKETLLIDGGGDPLIPSHKELRRRNKASRPPEPPEPKFERTAFTEEQIDRLMDAARDRLENANDEIGQQVWRKLESVKARFQPRRKIEAPVLEGPLRL
jgi:hypothetical protein